MMKKFFILAIFICYCLVLGYCNLARYDRGGGDLDLGVASQILWNTKHGNILYTSAPGLHSSIFKEHFNPIYLPLTLLYYYREDPRLLLLFQTLIIAIALIPLYRLASWRLGENCALLLCLTYAVNPAVHYINFFDFHPVTLYLTVYLFAFDAWHRNQRRRFFLIMLASLLVDESASVLMCFFGLFFLCQRRYRVAGFLLVTGLLFYLFLIYIFIPLATPPGQQPNYFYLWYFRYLPGSSGTAKLLSVIQAPQLLLQQLFLPSARTYAGMFGLFFAGLFAVGLFGLFYFMFTEVVELEAFGDLLLHRLLDMFFLVTFSMLVFSNLVVALTTIHRSKDIEFLMVQPVQRTSIFWAKYFESLFFSSWPFIYLFLPLCLAYGLASGFPLYFYPLAFLVFVLFLLDPL